MAFFAQIPAEQTFGSTLGAGLGQGLAQGAQLGLSGFLDNYYQQKKAADEINRKQNLVNKYLSTEEGKKQSPLVQNMLKAHAAGLVGEGAVTKALEPEIFKQKMQSLGIDLSGILPEQGNLSSSTNISPTEGISPVERPLSKPGYTKAQLQKMLLIPEYKDFATAQLQDLREEGKEERKLGMAGKENFYEKVESDRLRIPQERMASEMIVDAIKSGEIDPFSSAHIGAIARSFGAPESLTKPLETPGSKEFNTARKTFIGNTIQDAFRGTTSRTEINLAEDMLSELGVSKRGNLASIWGVQSAIDIREQRIAIADQLKEQGFPASKIPEMTDKMLKPYIKQVKDEYFEALRKLRNSK